MAVQSITVYQCPLDGIVFTDLTVAQAHMAKHLVTLATATSA